MQFHPVIPPLWIAILGAALVAFAWRTTAMRDASPRLRRILLALRLTGGGALIWLLAGPVVVERDMDEEDRPLAILALDASESMAVEDVGGDARIAAARREMAALSELLESENIATESWSFADAPRRLGAGDAPEPDGEATDIAGSAERMLAASPSRPPVALILFSDGIQTVRRGTDSATAMARARGAVVHGVCYGGEVAPPDLAVRTTDTRLIGFVGQRFDLSVRLESRGLPPREARMTLSGSESLADERLVRVGENATASTTFSFTPETGGRHILTVAVDAAPEEFDRTNNSITVGVTVLEERVRVLLLEGAPYWDSKFLAQCVGGDADMRLTVVQRLSRDRCFIVDDGEHEVRTDANAAPRTVEAFGRYDIVVLGKGVEALLGPDGARALQEWVRTRGGALLFLRGKPYNTFLPELAALEPVEWGDGAARNFRLQITRLGAAMGVVRFGLDEPVDVTFRALPALDSGRGVARIKSFVDVHAEMVLDFGGRAPAIMSRRYGKGLTVMLNFSGSWRWGFQPQTRERYAEAHSVFVGSLLRWLATRRTFFLGGISLSGVRARCMSRASPSPSRWRVG